MRVLIPVTQEIRNENALKRSSKISDDIHMLYVLDSSIIEKMERESSYVLDSQTLKALESALIDSQKKEAEAIASEFSIKRMHFEIGEYHDVIRRYSMKLKPELMMMDHFERRSLSLGVPVWVDAGNTIKTIVFHVNSIAKLERLKREFSLLSEIAKRLGADLRIHSTIREESALLTLEKMAPLTGNSEGDLIAMQFFDKRSMVKGRSALIFEGIRKI